MASNVSRAEHSAKGAAWNVPNALTVLRLVLVPVFLVLVLTEGIVPRWWALAVFCVAAATDLLDGKIARASGTVTDFGRIVDPIADKALTLGAFVILSVDGLIPWWFTIVVAVRELGITALRAILLKRDIVVSASSGGKLKTVLQMLFIVLLLVPWATFVNDQVLTWLAYVIYAIGGAALAVTVWSGALYVADGLRLWRKSDTEIPADQETDSPQQEANSAILGEAAELTRDEATGGVTAGDNAGNEE
ncbi:CDP-diacylglycerol--glycerol-3-phosphate 3-phosphatidyltransferase [Schaalia suimastitidis]|uniref:CDP-diacylglycerol--glycerol-3-phosphate 3-phosphatidyltransferase n=1 Tax=Schaalia suimastitidis TaxID=121163 RepID=UPI0003FCBCB9|nr:CDP-diacylglycerol--glycerol-3-phosphate 3-phosphatidyltransferase [Schaalia suimastitidis]